MRNAIPLVALCLLSTSAQAQPSCPQNFIQCNTYEYTSYAPTYSLYCPPEFEQKGTSTVSYDLSNGAFSCSSIGREYGSGAGFTVFDVYQLVGSAPDCSFPFKVNLHLMGKYTRIRALGADAEIDARLLDTFTLQQSHFYLHTTVTTTIDTVLTIPLDWCRDPFTIQYEFGTGGGWGEVTASAQILFSDLPQGVSVTSCQGFHEEGPIPTLPVTWGKVRARYR